MCYTGSMPRDYSWSRNSIPRTMNTIGEVAGLLALGRHQTRRRLIASGLPYKVYVKRWTNPATGQQYSRRAIGIPQKSAAELLKLDMMNSLGAGWKSFCRAIKSKNTETPPLLEDLIRSIGEIETDQPPFPLARPTRLKKPTIPRFVRVVLGLGRQGSGIGRD